MLGLRSTYFCANGIYPFFSKEMVKYNKQIYAIFYVKLSIPNVELVKDLITTAASKEIGMFGCVCEHILSRIFHCKRKRDKRMAHAVVIRKGFIEF